MHASVGEKTVGKEVARADVCERKHVYGLGVNQHKGRNTITSKEGDERSSKRSCGPIWKKIIPRIPRYS